MHLLTVAEYSMAEFCFTHVIKIAQGLSWAWWRHRRTMNGCPAQAGCGQKTKQS